MGQGVQVPAVERKGTEKGVWDEGRKEEREKRRIEVIRRMKDCLMQTCNTCLFFLSKYDLYSKAGQVPDMDSIKPYYEDLINKYCPGELRW